ncbi:Lipid A export ATP-binding/permease protein MsbA [Planctomycetes bacterium CA13]|uniref:Lipid A export ATP-binding/permease protein MsbA n=1 Tax=Novipirellula herctigrandis TaxID=2527986 RepID=A0A5C5Z5X7_9BACT|nr:Lipid A export ATP-binding/permease protein MsbA [Planctomycetes bacterium CA13]
MAVRLGMYILPLNNRIAPEQSHGRQLVDTRMKNFRRALGDAFRFWPLLLLATLCSVGTGALWGSNIGALFPVIKVTIAGESLQQWVDNEIDATENRIVSIENDIKAVEQQFQEAEAEDQLQVEALNVQLDAEIASLKSSKAMKPWIDDYMPASPFQTVVFVMCLLCIGTGIKHVLMIANTYAVSLIATTIARQIRQQIFAKALSMDQAGFAGYGNSGFVAHITHTTEMLSGGIVSVYGGAIREPMKLLSCLIGASLICWRLLLLSLVVVPVVVFMIVMLSRFLKTICQKFLEQSMGLHHVMLESLSNIRTVQAYTRESHEQARFDKATRDMQGFSMRIVLFNALNRPVTEILALGMMGTAIVAGSYMVLNRATMIWGIPIADRPMGVASMLIFFGLLVGATDPVRKMAQVIDGINTGMVAANMLYPLLDRQALIADPTEPVERPTPHRFIELNQVHFSYDGVHNVLNDVSLQIPFGSKIAIIGPNGAGKSSLINLICRFYDPQQGAVCLDGVDIRSLRLKDLRRHIALVTQTTELFNETIAYNIAYGVEQATREEIVAAAKLAHADDFVTNELPEQYDTMIGHNGLRLSGGQRQRIALARAILRNPEILILDEATSQVDMESERLIFQTLDESCKDCTVIFITHRATMLDRADFLLSFEHGTMTIERQPCDTTTHQVA